MPTEYGGYNNLHNAWLRDRKPFFNNNKSIAMLSLGRHCLQLFKNIFQPSRIFLPKYTCPRLKHYASQIDIELKFYNIDENFLPILNGNKSNDVVIINNYFGMSSNLKNWHSTMDRIAKESLILLDNTQCLLSKYSNAKYWSFFSPRKFLPVTDGGFILAPRNESIPKIYQFPQERDNSSGRVQWLFKALEDGDLSSSYDEFRTFRDNNLQKIPYAQMSQTTRFLMDVIDIEMTIKRRNRVFKQIKNFIEIHSAFSEFIISDSFSPIGFPVSVGCGPSTQHKLAKTGVYSVVYWPDLKSVKSMNKFERELTKKTLLLPINQKFDQSTLIKVRNIIDASR